MPEPDKLNEFLEGFVNGTSLEEMLDALAFDVEFKKADPAAVTPQYMTPGSAGFDLSTVEFAVVEPKQYVLISTGLVVKTPADNYLRITGRSSTPRKWGVHVIEGVIDSDYSGDDDVLKLQVWNPGNRAIELPRFARIAQGIFIPILRPKFVEQESMGDSRGGFGSTG